MLTQKVNKRYYYSAEYLEKNQFNLLKKDDLSKNRQFFSPQ